MLNERVANLSVGSLETLTERRKVRCDTVSAILAIAEPNKIFLHARQTGKSLYFAERMKKYAAAVKRLDQMATLTLYEQLILGLVNKNTVAYRYSYRSRPIVMARSPGKTSSPGTAIMGLPEYRQPPVHIANAK